MSKRLCFVSRIAGSAGPASFQGRLTSGLQRRGFQVGFDSTNPDCDVVLVIGGTRLLHTLYERKRRGVPIVQRLNGINWIHRRSSTGLRHFLRAELNNQLMRTVRSRFADTVVYQSKFAMDWWEREHGTTPCPSWVVYNGVPLDQYSPEEPTKRPEDRVVLLVVEGNLAGGYEIGLDWAMSLAGSVGERSDRPVELVIVGKVPDQVRASYDENRNFQVRWFGYQPPEEIPKLDRTAHVLFATDIHPACPNSVIEAMACGLPVVSFDTGALGELVQGESGRIVDYGGNPWRLDSPDIQSLSDATMDILGDQPRFRLGARNQAEARFGLERMVDEYLQALGWN